MTTSRVQMLFPAVAKILLLHIPTVYNELLAPILGGGAADPIAALPGLQEALRTGINAYCAVCLQHILIGGSIVHSVVRTMSKSPDDSSTVLLLPWVIGMCSMFLALASILTSAVFTNSLRTTPWNELGMRVWLQNAQRNAKSPWKNVSALLAAPSALCVWACILFVIHAVGWNGYYSQPIEWLEEPSLPRAAPFFRQSDAKLSVFACACFIIAYTIKVCLAFVQLNDPRPRSVRSGGL